MSRNNGLQVVFSFATGEVLISRIDGRLNPYKRKQAILNIIKNMGIKPTHFQIFKNTTVVSEKIEIPNKGEL